MPDSRHSSVPRALRVAEEVQRILGGVLQTKVQLTSAEMVTVTHVELTRDLRIAKVFMSLLNPRATDEQAMQEMQSRRKEIRYHLGAQLRTKYVPDLRFYLDQSVERSNRIDAILEELHRNAAPAKQ